MIALSLLVAVVGTAALAFFWQQDRHLPGRIEAGTVAEIESAEVVYLPDHRVFVVATDGEFQAFSDDSRHNGDRVLYCANDQTFSSPLHGERFDLLGRYVGGPASGDLGHYPVMVAGNQVVVDVSDGAARPDRSAVSDYPTGSSCRGLEGPPGFYEDGTK